jgi:S1-C subfamily serine protease
MRRAVGLPDADGLLVRLVEDNSPASQAGLAQGDLIVLAAGQPVSGVDDLFEALGTAKDGAIQRSQGPCEPRVDVQLGAAAGDAPDAE